MYSTQHNSTLMESSKFIRDLTNLIAEISKVKQDLLADSKNRDLWRDDYDKLKSELSDILELAHHNSSIAVDQYRSLAISNFDSFTNYMYNIDINAVRLRKGSNERTKLLRARRKNKRCPECHAVLSSSSGSVVCSSCGYTSTSTKDGSPDYRSNTDSTKHTLKHLDALSGTKKAPANILKIIKHVSLWLTDMSYISAWLNSEGKLQSFVKKFNSKKSSTYSVATFQTLKFEPIPDNMWEYELYKLISDELYALLEKAKRLSKMKSSNMESLNIESLKHVLTAYADDNRINDHLVKIPNINDTYNYNGVDYEIGLYINSLSLIAETVEDSMKAFVDELFGHSVTMPGLMFNFRDVYTQSDNVPKRYNFTQEYIYITHETFNVSYIDISLPDKAAIVDLILKFNEFYKKSSFQKSGNECNAPLFCCALISILTHFRYFAKYMNMLKFIPSKDKNTSAHIKGEWFKFMCENPEICKKYSKETLDDDGVYTSMINTLASGGDDSTCGDKKKRSKKAKNDDDVDAKPKKQTKAKQVVKKRGKKAGKKEIVEDEPASIETDENDAVHMNDDYICEPDVVECITHYVCNTCNDDKLKLDSDIVCDDVNDIEHYSDARSDIAQSDSDHDSERYIADSDEDHYGNEGCSSDIAQSDDARSDVDDYLF